MKKKNKNKKTKKTKIMLHVDGYMSSLKTLKSMIEKKKIMWHGWLPHVNFFISYF